MKDLVLDSEQLAAASDFLKAADLFAGLSQEQLHSVLQKALYKEADAGELLLLQGVPSEGFLILLSGSAAAILTLDDGSQTEVGVLEPGETLGEMGLLSQKPRSASLFAREVTRLLWFDSAAFQALLSEVPGFPLALSRTLSDRLRSSLDRILDLSNEVQGLRERVFELEAILMNVRSVPPAPPAPPPQENHSPHVYNNSTVHIHHHYYDQGARPRYPEGT